jgi:transcriptional regulator GlxA family with amidase domain
MSVYTIDGPVSGYVTQASRARPLLCFRLDLDPQRIAHHVLDVFPRGIPHTSGTSVVEVAPTDAAIVACACRMLELDQQTDEARLLAPVITDEILIRLLRGPLGTRVAQIGHAESALRRITKSVAWIRANFAQQINVDTLAALANMSPSTFHHHFKGVTGMSPVQFQKSLRLQEAKRLLATTDESAALVSRMVGYASASQFSREYARQFGAPPSRDPSVSGASAVAP